MKAVLNPPHYDSARGDLGACTVQVLFCVLAPLDKDAVAKDAQAGHAGHAGDLKSAVVLVDLRKMFCKDGGF